MHARVVSSSAKIGRTRPIFQVTSKCLGISNFARSNICVWRKHPQPLLIPRDLMAGYVFANLGNRISSGFSRRDWIRLVPGGLNFKILPENCRQMPGIFSASRVPYPWKNVYSKTLWKWMSKWRRGWWNRRCKVRAWPQIYFALSLTDRTLINYTRNMRHYAF